MMRWAAVLAAIVTTFAALAADGTKFRGSGAGGRYRVSVVLQPGDDPETVSRQLAATYGGRVEPYAEEGFSGFVVALAESRARLLSGDPRVLLVEELAPETDMSPPPAIPARIETQASRPPLEVATNAAAGFGTYTYDGGGNILAIGDTADQDLFAYDNLGRLQTADVRNGPAQTYTYDRWGNILTIATTGDPVIQKLGVDRTTNRIDKTFDNGEPRNVFGSYDSRGNLTSYNSGTFVYDGLEMMKESTVNGTRRFYIYSASDERVVTVRSVGGSITGSDWTIRDPNGRVLRRLTQTGSTLAWTEDYVYRGGQLLAAAVPGPEKIRHFHLDHLGTPRLTTGNGGVRLAEHHYQPFGRELTVSTDGEKAKFTGHERDADTLDYMHARYYEPFMGRFLSVDPVWDYEAAKRSPQLWNRYSYVGNNPVAYVDPSGKVRIRAHNTGHVGSSRPYLYDITFENRTGLAGRALGGAAKRVLGPVLKHLPGALDKGADLVVGKDVGTDSTKFKEVGAVAGVWDTAKFEGAIQDAFKQMGATSVAGSGYYDAGDLETLQKAADAVLTDMVANGKITQQEADKVRKEYNIQRLRDEAEAASLDMNPTDDPRN